MDKGLVAGVVSPDPSLGETIQLRNVYSASGAAVMVTSVSSGYMVVPVMSVVPPVALLTLTVAVS